MQTSQTGIDLIKKYEGFSARIYLCPAGKPTIGYGHLILAGEKFPPYGISESDAENLLKQDVGVAENAINNLVAADISQNQFDALASFTYNLGAKSLEKSTLLRLINENNMQAAANEFPKWVFAGDKKLAGLERRRAAEMELFSTATSSSGFPDNV